ncbi:MAG: hypothetical protein H0V18_12040 [Pyrinomonadaceae bacterium]|nr:hypothetical protein [Pyrinomonadaceae bacterium]
MRTVWPGVAAALIAGVVGISSATAQPSACGRVVTGGTQEERAAVGRILCLMPGTAIESVQILEQPPDAPADALWLALTVPPAPRASSPGLLNYTRAKWEVDIAAAAIRDGFFRLGLARVVAYEELSRGNPPDTDHLVGIALRAWSVPRWSTGARPRSLGHRAGTWAQLQAKLDVLSRRFQVRTRLERFNPFGKAPVVTVLAGDGGAFIDAGGFDAYKRALQFGEARYDGVLLQLRTPTGAGLQVFTVDRGRRSTGCTRYGRIPHKRYEICPSD